MREGHSFCVLCALSLSLSLLLLLYPFKRSFLRLVLVRCQMSDGPFLSFFFSFSFVFFYFFWGHLRSSSRHVYPFRCVLLLHWVLTWMGGLASVSSFPPFFFAFLSFVPTFAVLVSVCMMYVYQ